MGLRNLEPANCAAVEARRRAYEAEWEAILAEGQAAGAMAPGDLRLTAMAVIAMLTGVVTWYREGGRLSRADVEDPARDLAFPESVVDMMRGQLGQPPGGWPEAIQAKVLKGDAAETGRPGASRGG